MLPEASARERLMGDVARLYETQPRLGGHLLAWLLGERCTSTMLGSLVRLENQPDLLMATLEALANVPGSGVEPATANPRGCLQTMLQRRLQRPLRTGEMTVDFMAVEGGRFRAIIVLDLPVLGLGAYRHIGSPQPSKRVAMQEAAQECLMHLQV